MTKDKPGAGQPALRRAHRVMIVEDEIILAEMTRRILDKWGYHTVGVVTSGEEAVTQAAILAPDLILMDIRLAGQMDGLQAAREIAANCATPVIFTTGYNHEVAENTVAGLGVRSLALSKPVPPLQLKAAIESLLR